MELQVVTWHHLTQKSPAARCVVNHEHMKVVSIQGGSNGVHHPILSTVPMGCWMFAQCSHLCYDWGLGGLTLTPMGMTPMGMVTSAWVEHGGPELGHWFSRSPPKNSAEIRGALVPYRFLSKAPLNCHRNWTGLNWWNCHFHMGLSENGVYSQGNSHLIGIMIINHWV